MAIHARHIDVTDHQAERGLPRRQQSVFGRAYGAVIVTGQLQGFAQRFTQGMIVLDQQYLDRHESLPVALTPGISGKKTMAQVPRPGRERNCTWPW